MVFIAVPIPDHVATVLQTTVDSFASHLDQHVPREKWHITLWWLGDAEIKTSGMADLSKPLSQTFLPTISLRYAGPSSAMATAGKRGKQLWVYAQLTPALINLRQELLTRLQRAGVMVPEVNRPWVPHIHLGDFLAETATSLADRLLPATTFVPTVANVLHDYVIEGTIPFS